MIKKLTSPSEIKVSIKSSRVTPPNKKNKRSHTVLEQRRSLVQHHQDKHKKVLDRLISSIGDKLLNSLFKIKPHKHTVNFFSKDSNIYDLQISIKPCKKSRD